MKNFYVMLLGFLFLCLSIGKSTKAQTISIDAEYRPRTEFRQGLKKPLTDIQKDAYVVLQRTRLNTDYKSNSLNARLSLQDARIWGQSDLKSTAPQISVFEAWFDLLLTSGISIEAGRQAFQYDDQRLFGAGVWSNTGNSHDAILLKYKDASTQTHFAAAYNNTTDALSSYKYNVSGMYQSMGFLWFSQKLTNELSLTAIGITEALPRSMVTSGAFKAKTSSDSSSTVTYGRFTYGGNLIYKDDQSIINGSITAYGQTGRDNKMGDLSACLLAAQGIIKLSDNFSASLGFDYLSGTSFEDTLTVGTRKSYSFNKLYGTNHKFNGSMEYWASAPSGGLVDYYLEGNYSYDKDISFNLSLHKFSLAKEMFAGKTLINDKNLGGEVDLSIAYQWSKDINIQLGYSLYFKTNSTLLINSISGNTKTPIWGFCMLTVKPSLYKSIN
jgi:hypothetical protein